jgi:hypothetical protein
MGKRIKRKRKRGLCRRYSDGGVVGRRGVMGCSVRS